MAYIPTGLTLATWSSPITITGSDNVTNLDEAVNSIITTDPASLVTHINTELAKIPTYLNDELTLIDAEFDTHLATALTYSNNASTSATASASSATASAGSATDSANSATASASSATASAGSASASSTSATNSATSATASAGSATASAGSATDSANSATASATSATASALSETNAGTSETNASTSASNASTSATASATSASTSATSATLSSKYATELEDVEVETGKYSAFHWSEKASATANSIIVVDTLTSTSTTQSLSANMGKTLNDTKASLSGATFTGLVAYDDTAFTTNIDCSLGNSFSKTVTGAFTQTFSNVPASGNACVIVLDLVNAGAFTITWDAGIIWDGGVAPTFTASGKDMVTLYTRDGGTSWNASAKLGYA